MFYHPTKAELVSSPPRHCIKGPPSVNLGPPAAFTTNSFQFKSKSESISSKNGHEFNPELNTTSLTTDAFHYVYVSASHTGQQGIIFLACPFICLLPNLWMRYFEN